MSAVLDDLRHAVRVFARRPALTIVAILSLAVATGPNAALFSIVHGLFFRQLPVERPDELVGIRARGESLTYPDWLDIRQQASSFASVVAWERVAFPLSLDARTEVLPGNYVSADYFTTLGVTAAAGRLFSPEQDERQHADLPLVISYSYWQRRFGGAASAIGATPLVAGRTFVIVGVTPESFRGLDVQLPIDAWIPFSAAQAIGRLSPRILADREHGRLETVLGRLRPGATIDQAQADVDRVSRGPGAANSSTGEMRSFRTFSYAGNRAERGVMLGGIVMGLVGLVLLVACANVAGLLVSLAEDRRREVAVRVSLGASRGQIVRQFLIEGLVLWVAGALAGLLLAAWLMRIPLAPPVGTAVLDYDIRFDTAVYLYTIGVALLTSVIFGLVPALRATRTDTVADLKGARAVSRARRSWSRGALVAGQIAVSQFLLAGAVLGVRSYLNVRDFAPGFDVDKSIIAVTLAPRGTEQATGQQSRHAELVDRLRTIPGVLEVSGAASLPLSGSGGGMRLATSWPGAPVNLKVRANLIRPRFFSAMGIQLVAGRDFESQDATAAASAIVNETLARQIAPEGGATGRWIRVDGIARQVVGVAQDGRYGSMRDEQEPYLYLPALSSGLLLLETTDRATGVVESVHRAVAEIVPDLYVADVTTLKDVMRLARYADVLGAWLIGGLGLLAAFLTAVGVFGVVAHSVTSRTREFGIRMALGAERRAIVAMVLRQGLRLAAIGAPVGAVAAVIGGQFASRLLFGLSPLDPVSYLSGVGVVLSVVVLACLRPARRASGVEPAAALRHE